MASVPSYNGDLSGLAEALQAMPRKQARLPISLRIHQELESDSEGTLEKLRVMRVVGGFNQCDHCRIIKLLEPDGRWAIEYIRFDSGYETPDDLEWDGLED